MDEINKMVKDAEAHAEEDKRFHELVSARNQADNMIHATEKSLKDMGDKVENDERQRIENAIEELKKAVKNDNKSEIETKTQALAEASGKLAERVYAQTGTTQGKQTKGEEHAKASAGTDDVVDAEFEEVDNQKK